MIGCPDCENLTGGNCGKHGPTIILTSISLPPGETPQADLYAADCAEMFLAADGSMMCEKHPGWEWPHDACAGPGMPWSIQGRTLIEETLLAKCCGEHGICMTSCVERIEGER